MKWEKLGLIFDSCALMPIVEPVPEHQNRVKVYFSPRDDQGRSQLHYFEIDLRNPDKILKVSSQPIFTHGVLGAFDDSGVTPGSFSEIGGKKVFYYTGWNLTRTVPMNNSIGIAEFDHGTGCFKRYGDGPIMTRTLHEPYSCASPFVMKDESLYRMWYASMDQWRVVDGEPRHFYNIKYAESRDGIQWQRNGHIALNYETDEEYAFGRPFVLKENGIYKIWYAVRGKSYKIGYAESKDGLRWTRMDDHAGIGCSESGWDSEMIEYPFIFDHQNNRYMFYNGNDYGKTGIGLARLIK